MAKISAMEKEEIGGKRAWLGTDQLLSEAKQ